MSDQYGYCDDCGSFDDLIGIGTKMICINGCVIRCLSCANMMRHCVRYPSVRCPYCKKVDTSPFSNGLQITTMGHIDECQAVGDEEFVRHIIKGICDDCRKWGLVTKIPRCAHNHSTGHTCHWRNVCFNGCLVECPSCSSKLDTSSCWCGWDGYKPHIICSKCQMGIYQPRLWIGMSPVDACLFSGQCAMPCYLNFDKSQHVEVYTKVIMTATQLLLRRGYSAAAIDMAHPHTINKRTSLGQTTLELAAQYSPTAIVYLIDMGAMVEMPTSNNQDILEYCVQLNIDKDIIMDMLMVGDHWWLQKRLPSELVLKVIDMLV